MDTRVTPPEPMLIGALAARTGRTVHTIRWYETQALMPGVARDDGGRRVYREDHVVWLDLLDRLRRSGMSIREMRTYTALVQGGHATLAERAALLRAHREHIDAQIAELQAARDVVDAKIDFYARWARDKRRPPLPEPPPERSSRRPPG